MTDQECVNTIRMLSADMIQKAKSGHPGAPMGLAPAAHVLWSRIMNYDVTDTKWMNRDRFVLSNGHASALLYSMLHISGVPQMTTEELQKFRQLNSLTPGHPESHLTDGVEVTTGPLGQGLANAVGMAIGQAHLAAKYNKDGFPVVDHFTYVFTGDGCLMEGVTAEAASMAGHLGLGRLIVLYDDNKISIDGSTDLAFTENVQQRFEAYGWHTSTVADADTNLDAIEAAIHAAKAVTDKPSLISLKTTIGFGAPKEGTEKVHGSPLGDDGVASTKVKFGMDPEKKFFVSEGVKSAYAAVQARNAEGVAKWKASFAAYETSHPAEAAELKRRVAGELPVDALKAALPTFTPEDKPTATRALGGAVINAIAGVLPEFLGGSADLNPSTKTYIKSDGDFQKGSEGERNIRFGVREHGMGAVVNGLAAYGGFLPFAATFLNFVGYAQGAVRISAIAGHQVIYVGTHDSIGVGEDGPTHQPIELVPMLRATPNMYAFRPADGNETSGAYLAALTKLAHAPSVMCLSRQNLPHLAGTDAALVAQGAYVLVDTEGAPDVVLVASGSEVALCVEAAKAAGVKARVVSMPCMDLFDEQSAEYKASVLPAGVPVVSVEASSTLGWAKYAHASVGMTTFGLSAPGAQLFEHFGFTVDNVVAVATKTVEHYKAGGCVARPTF